VTSSWFILFFNYHNDARSNKYQTYKTDKNELKNKIQYLNLQAGCQEVQLALVAISSLGVLRPTNDVDPDLEVIMQASSFVI